MLVASLLIQGIKHCIAVMGTLLWMLAAAQHKVNLPPAHEADVDFLIEKLPSCQVERSLYTRVQVEIQAELICKWSLCLTRKS